MAKRGKTTEQGRELAVHSAELQIDFWATLQQLRSRYLSQGLSQAMSSLDIASIDRELAQYVDGEGLKILATVGMRGETFFPVPSLLSSYPGLLGYCRLLYGISQNEFYCGQFSQFISMEAESQLSGANDTLLPQLCRSLCKTGLELLKGVQPPSIGAVHELQLLTIGPQLRGSQNNRIGSTSILDSSYESHKRFKALLLQAIGIK
jgi:hypothetical protein